MSELIKLGILLDSTRLSQILISVLTELTILKKNDNVAHYLFVEQQEATPVKIDFPIYHLSDAYFFPGTMIANSLAGANKLRHFAGPKQKYFYLWNLEWIYLKEKNYGEISNIFNDRRLKLIAPSKHYATLYKKYWREVDYTLENFHISELLGVNNGKT